MNVGKIARDARPDLHRFHRIEPAGVFVPIDDLALQGPAYRNGGTLATPTGRLGLRRLRAVAAGARQQKGQQQTAGRTALEEASRHLWTCSAGAGAPSEADWVDTHPTSGVPLASNRAWNQRWRRDQRRKPAGPQVPQRATTPRAFLEFEQQIEERLWLLLPLGAPAPGIGGSRLRGLRRGQLGLRRIEPIGDPVGRA